MRAAWARHAASAHYPSVQADPGDDLLMVHTELERGAPFCDNPACALHVRVRDAIVEGGGNWLTLPDGRTFGRSRFGETLLCDACGTRRGPVRLSADPPQELKRWRVCQ
jgi:hypothetical protein